MASAFYRAVISGCFLLLIALILRRPLPSSKDQWIYIFVIGITATTVGFWGMFYAAPLVSPGLATVLTSTQPLIAIGIGWFVLKEHISKLSLLLIFLGFFGIIIVSSSSLFNQDEQLLKGTAFILFAATGIAISNVLLKLSSKKLDIFYAMGFQLLIGSIPLGLIAAFDSEKTILSSFSTLVGSTDYLISVVVLSIVGTAIPFLIWYWLMEKAPLYQLNIFSFLTPVFGLILGIHYFDEYLSLSQWIGVLIVAISVSLIGRDINKNRNHPQ